MIQKELPRKVDLELRNYFLDQEYSPSECYQCGTCTATCPLNRVKTEKFTVRKLFHLAQLGLQPDFLVWECTTCKECETRCPREVEIVESIISLRRYAFQKRYVPRELEKVLWNILEEGNPTGDPRSNKAIWATGLNLKDATQGTDVLLYVGGPNAYDPRLQKVTKDLVSILQSTNFDFGILGIAEPPSGETVKVTGETAYLEMLIEKNVELFNSTSASKILTISPHDYDFIKNTYPHYGLEAEVIHYTEFLEDLITNEKITFKTRLEQEITYHDPCYLGRYNDVFDAPRAILENIPGVQLIEMDRVKSNALCCGGGGGQMFFEIEPGERLSDARVREAGETGASSLFTSCPFCIQNFEDSSKSTGTKISVGDVVEIVRTAMGNGSTQKRKK